MATCMCSCPNITAPSIGFREPLGFRLDHDDGALGAGDDQIQPIAPAPEGRIQQILAVA
jgi:hypothetical protein